VKRKDWTVGDHSIRPAGPTDRCTYCNTPVGMQHSKECVIRQRTVVVEVRTRMTISVPENWSPENIEFHRNESSLS